MSPIFSLKEVHRFITCCLMACGAPKKAASTHATILIEADKRGHVSHGLNRLEMYVRELQAGICCPCHKPKIIKDAPSVACVDAKHCLGGVSGI